MAKIMLELSEENPDNTIDMNLHEDKLIARMVTVVVSYEGGYQDKIIRKSYSSVQRCPSSYF